MTDALNNVLLARLRSVDWFYEYSDDYSTWKKEKDKIDKLRHEFSNFSIDQNQELLKSLMEDVAGNKEVISFMRMIIAKQLLINTVKHD